MAVKSRDFVGIAEGIKSHELSAKGKIENLKGTISELSTQKRSLDNQISYLEAALAAAYEDTDEDGDPDYSLISSIEAQINSAENELSGVEQELDSTNGELAQTEIELESVMEEKEQTLFEIQERARKTSQNISIASGMYGAYAGVGDSLQSSMQTSLSSLSQAASILGGDIDRSQASGKSMSESGNTIAGSISSDQGNLSAGALSAFVGSQDGSSNEYNPILGASNFLTQQSNSVTPATTSNFHSGQKSINPQKTLNFKTEQNANAYVASSFSESDEMESVLQPSSFSSSQKSLRMESRISAKKNNHLSGSDATSTSRSDLAKKREWAKQYEVGFTPIASNISDNAGGDGTTTIGERQRELGHETGMEQASRPMLNKESSAVKGIYGAVIASGINQSKSDSDNSQVFHNMDKKSNLVEELNKLEGSGITKEQKFRKSLSDYPKMKSNRILGLTIPGVDVSQNFIIAVYNRLEHADRISRSLFEQALKNNMISIRDGNSKEEYYDIDSKEIYLNLEADKADDMGRGTGLFHEVGHAIDHALGGSSFLSNKDSFLQCLKTDCQRLIDKIESDENWAAKFKQLIRKCPDAYSVSDILEGLTNGKISGGCGHMAQDANYWESDKYAVCNEAFAHFFEASMGASKNRLKYIKTIFPSAYEEYQNLIKSHIAKEREELIRELY